MYFLKKKLGRLFIFSAILFSFFSITKPATALQINQNDFDTALSKLDEARNILKNKTSIVQPTTTPEPGPRPVPTPEPTPVRPAPTTISIIETLLPEGRCQITNLKTHQAIFIEEGGNAYSYNLEMKPVRPFFNLFVIRKDGRQKIFGTLTGDYTFHPNVEKGKSIKQGYLSAYRGGCFQTSYYKYVKSNPIKTFKVQGTTNKYLITTAREYSEKKDSSFFGVDKSDFLMGLNKNDPRAQFVITSMGAVAPEPTLTRIRSR